MTQSKKFVLVVEDDESYALVLKGKLPEEGFDVMIASNGKEALEIAHERKPDLIFLDLVMPVKDGFDVLKDLKSDPILKGVPVLVASNLGQDGDIKKAKDLGAADYFIKANVSLNEAVEKIKQYLG